MLSRAWKRLAKAGPPFLDPDQRFGGSIGGGRRFSATRWLTAGPEGASSRPEAPPPGSVLAKSSMLAKRKPRRAWSQPRLPVHAPCERSARGGRGMERGRVLVSQTPNARRSSKQLLGKRRVHGHGANRGAVIEIGSRSRARTTIRAT